MTVPCNGCTLCCQNDCIRLLPGDDISIYQTQPHPYLSGALMIAHKPQGSCVYLGASGCTIHDTKPQMCREMDCREISKKITYTQARKLRVVHVWQRGKHLLREGL